MKQVIVLAAVLPLLLVFFLQFACEQQSSSNIAMLSDIVYAAKEEARQQGCFTESIKSRMTETICKKLGVSEGDVTIEATDRVKYRINSADGMSEDEIERGMIYYKVTAPVGKLMAGRSLFGLKEKDNTYYYTVEGRAASERLRQ